MANRIVPQTQICCYHDKHAAKQGERGQWGAKERLSDEEREINWQAIGGFWNWFIGKKRITRLIINGNMVNWMHFGRKTDARCGSYRCVYLICCSNHSAACQIAECCMPRGCIFHKTQCVPHTLYSSLTVCMCVGEKWNCTSLNTHHNNSIKY